MGRRRSATVHGPASGELFLPIARAKRWSPDDPFLYDLQVTLKRGDSDLDRVTSYFGMRKISLLKDDQGMARIALNGAAL